MVDAAHSIAAAALASQDDCRQKDSERKRSRCDLEGPD